MGIILDMILTIDQVAARFGVAPATVRLWVRSGRIVPPLPLRVAGGPPCWREHDIVTSMYRARTPSKLG